MKNNLIKNMVIAAALVISPFSYFTKQSVAVAEEKEIKEIIYEVTSEIARYKTAEDALKKTNSVGNYKPGKYFFFSESKNGMINITMDKGEPGSWVNPEELYKKESKDVAIAVFEDMVYLHMEVPSFDSSEDAAKRNNPGELIKPGPYFFIEQKEGALKIIDVDGKEYWITLSLNYLDNYKEDKNNKYDYHLEKTEMGYYTAEDAVNKKDARKIYSKGDYFLYKETKDAVNISKVKGKPGAWIAKDRNKYKGLIYLNKEVEGFKTADNAINGKEPQFKLKPALYYIYKNAEGAVNISRKYDNIGAWIKADEMDLAFTDLPDEDMDGLFYLEKDLMIFMSSEDAISSKNPVKEYEAGYYFIYKYENGAFNITSKYGQPGGWIYIK